MSLMILCSLPPHLWQVSAYATAFESLDSNLTVSRTNKTTFLTGFVNNHEFCSKTYLQIGYFGLKLQNIISSCLFCRCRTLTIYQVQFCLKLLLFHYIIIENLLAFEIMTQIWLFCFYVFYV